MKNKIYTNAPLPFQGQKRFFLKGFREALTELIGAGKINTVVDLFGGSGLLSHTTKRMYPGLRVVYNDFDNYHVRLNGIDSTNRITNAIQNMVKECAYSRRIPEGVKEKILDFILSEEQKGRYIDYITLSSQLLFSGSGYTTSYNSMRKRTFYNRVASKGYNAQGYLDGIEIVQSDYKCLYEAFRDNPGVLFVVDPPYLSTDVLSYNKATYWNLTDYLDVINVLRSCHYIYFTSSKSQLVELFEYLSRNHSFDNPFANAQKKERQAKLNQDAQYTDIMLYCRQ